MKKIFTNKTTIITITLAIISVVAVSALLIVLAGDGGNTTRFQGLNGQQNNSPADYGAVTALSSEADVEVNDDYDSIESLQYLIEEEKLAHDVYNYFYDKYGARIFNNIGTSETTHQNRVLGLLNTRNIPDPRLESAGQFANQDLQSLYNQLIEQGNQSLTEAYKVGVAIEEKDIADLQSEIDRTTDSEIKTVLISLRDASENHLRAFNRQL